MADSITLLPKFDKFLSRMFESGRYSDVDDLINSAVGLLESWEMARSELSASSNIVHESENFIAGNYYKDLLACVEHYLGRNSSLSNCTSIPISKNLDNDNYG